MVKIFSKLFLKAEAQSQFKLGEKSQMYFRSLDDRLGPDQCREQCCDEWPKSVL